MAEVTPRERRIFIAAVSALVPLLLVFLVVADHHSKPRGKRVAAIDLLGDASEVAIDATAGTKVRFSVDVEARLGNSEIVDLLEQTRLSMVLAESGRADQETSCAAWAGTAHATPNSSQFVQYRKGVEVACAFTAQSSGPARIRVRATWPQGPPPRHATVAVRLGDERTYP